MHRRKEGMKICSEKKRKEKYKKKTNKNNYYNSDPRVRIIHKVATVAFRG